MTSREVMSTVCVGGVPRWRRECGLMRRLVEFRLNDGGSVLVQVEDDDRGGDQVTRGWADRDRRIVEQAQQSFEQAVGRVQPALEGLLGQLRSIAETPEQISVEFGLQLSAEVGAFVAGASSSGNFKVSMTWNRRPRTGDA
ncbi:CU044_2847 family protein [Blastococcus mobilis]|nr:CU044_2847 family protein [Blastococcus mobilis]